MKKFAALAIGALLSTTMLAGPQLGKKEIDLKYSQAKVFTEQTNNCIGNLNAKIVIVDFFDYNCSDCKFISHYLEELVKSNKNVKAVFVDYPLLGASSTMAAKAALASKLQNKYMPLHNAMIASKAHRLSQTQINDFAKSAEIDVAKLEKDMNSEKVQSELLNNIITAKQFKLPFVPIVLIAKLQVNSMTKALEAPKTAMIVLTDSHLKIKQTLQNEVNKLNAE